jgi:integrase
MKKQLRNSLEPIKRASSEQAAGRTARLPKGDVRYWRERIFKPAYSRRGKSHDALHWAVQIQCHGERHKWSLETANRDAAAAKAKKVFLFAQTNGWEATLAEFRAKSIAKKTDATVGDLLEELRNKSDAKAKTLEGYAVALRKIVSDVMGQPHGRGGGKKKREQWRKKVHAVRLARLTPAKIQKWKLDFVARAGTDPIKQRAARISANTFLRRAKSLFAPELTRHLEEVQLPTPSPFDGVEFYKRTSMKYRSTFEVFGLIKDAKNELAESKPEQFKILLLAVMAGLRRKEIDTLEWPAFRWETSVIRIEPTRWFHPKSEDSIGDIEIDPELLELFRGYCAKAKGPFVIESDVDPRLDTGWEHYRCTSIFEGLIAWLRKKGVTTNTPLHTLRKEFGSRIAAEHGIYAASRLLRHADIQTTASHYLDKKKRVTAGMGHLLTSKVVDLPRDDHAGDGVDSQREGPGSMAITESSGLGQPDGNDRQRRRTS